MQMFQLNGKLFPLLHLSISVSMVLLAFACAESLGAIALLLITFGLLWTYINVIFVCAGFYALFSASRKEQKVKRRLKDNPYSRLREMVFSLNAQVLKREVEGSKQSLCTVMEWGVADTTTTLVSVIDGATSLYLSSGGVVIGGGFHKSVADASSAFREKSEQLLDLMQIDADHVLPLQGRVCFYVITNDGVYKYEGAEEALAGGNDPFRELFADAQKVICELRKNVSMISSLGTPRMDYPEPEFGEKEVRWDYH